VPIVLPVIDVANTGIYRLPARNKDPLAWPTHQPELVDDLPDVPVLPETLLHMELRQHDFSVDLRDLSELVLSDLGATLQILRLASREYGAGEGRPLRIEDCISDLGVEACLRAAARQPARNDARHRPILEFWAHCREVAGLSRALVGSMAGFIRPDEAYLVGLFHALGDLPGILGWESSDHSAGESAAHALRLAERWTLPLCVQEYFAEQLRHGSSVGSSIGAPMSSSMRWTGIVRRAHQMATRSSARCPLTESPALRLEPARHS